MITPKDYTPKTLFTVYPTFPPLPAGASAELVEWHRGLTQWYDDLKRVLQAQSIP